MLLRIPNVLNAEQVRWVRAALDNAGDAWVDGLATAGYQGRPSNKTSRSTSAQPWLANWAT